MAKQDPKTKLCGSNLNEETTVLRWASFTNYELLPPIMAWINPVIGRSTATPDQLEKLEESCELTARAIEKENGQTVPCWRYFDFGRLVRSVRVGERIPICRFIFCSFFTLSYSLCYSIQNYLVLQSMIPDLNQRLGLYETLGKEAPYCP